MVPYVSARLPQSGGDLRKAVPLEKVKSHGLPLVIGQASNRLLPIHTPKNGVSRIIGLTGRCSDHPVAQFASVIPRIELAHGQIASALDRSMVRHLDNPGAGGTLRAIEDGAFSLDEEEEVLNEVFGFGSVSKDARGDAASKPGVPLKKDAQRI
jgi:hypothetical protein